MSKFNLILLFVICLSTVYPVTSVSRWFSSSYEDLRVTLRRYGHCVGDLSPLKAHNLNETDYLIHQMHEFLSQGTYDNEQLANVSMLMDNICRSDEKSYAISVHIDVTKYSGPEHGRENRCRAIDEAMDAMYGVFRRAAYNRTEPLDFSVIQFYPNATDKSVYYNLTDLINTSWIKSDAVLENVCKITDSVKEYVQNGTSNSVAQDRSHQQQTGVLSSMMDIVDRVLDPILGLQRRLYWESNNRLEQAYSGLSYQFGNIRGAFGSRYRSIMNRFSSSNVTQALNTTVTNATLAKSTNAPKSTTVLSNDPKSTVRDQKSSVDQPKSTVTSWDSLNKNSTINY